MSKYLGVPWRPQWGSWLICGVVLLLCGCVTRNIIEDRNRVGELAEFNCVGDPRLPGSRSEHRYINQDSWTVQNPSGFSIVLPGDGCLTPRPGVLWVDYLLAVMATGDTRGRNMWRGFERQHVAVIFVTDFQKIFGTIQPRGRAELRDFLHQDLSRLPRGPFASLYPRWEAPRFFRYASYAGDVVGAPFRLVSVDVDQSEIDRRCVVASVISEEEREGTGWVNQMAGAREPNLTIRQEFTALLCPGPHGNGAVVAFAQLYPVDDSGAAARGMALRARAISAFRSIQFQ